MSRMCIWVMHQGQTWPSVRGRTRRFTQRGRMPTLMLRERLHGEGLGRVIVAVPSKNNRLGCTHFINQSLLRSGCRLHANTDKEKAFFSRFNSENGIWIECDAHHYQPEERLLVKPDKSPKCERVIVCQYSSCSSFFVWRWAEVSLHRLLPAGVTTWLNDFWLREKLSPESQWKLTSMPVLFFSSVL